MGDGALVELIVGRLSSPQDRHAASLVCKIWSDAVVWAARKIMPRCRKVLPKLASRFRRITWLDLSCFLDVLADEDLVMAASAFPNLRSITIGCSEQPQDFITDKGLKGFASKCSLLQRIELSNLPRLQDSAIDALSRNCRRLRYLHLENCTALTDSSLEAVSRFSELQQISLKGSFSFTSSGLAKIGAGCKKLTSVCFALEFISDCALKSLASGCPELQEIDLKYRTAGLGSLVECHSLLSLRVETDERIFMDEVLMHIAAANKNLKEFVFVHPINPLSEAAVVGIVSRCPNLQKLCLEAFKLTEMGLLSIMNCKNLKYLELLHFHSSGQGLAEIGLCQLDLRHFALRSAKCIRDVELQMFMDGNRRLEHLDLHYCCGPSGIGFSAIGACSRLQYLDLSFTEVDDLSLMEIGSGARHVKHLRLVKCEAITSVLPVARFAEVEFLNLDQCPFVTDEGLNALAVNCPRLENVSLACTRVTDIGITYLKNCSALRELRIPYCRGVNGPGIIEIANSCRWFRHISVSHRLRGSKVVELLREKWFIVSFEIDDMALVPFGFNPIV
ncbi:hypothetical protein O6H91_15G032300 [Diphasiastrum complanatum]|nr:hypothetical protein O6H91_15G032300 [Diphasiastrum complanatum]